MNKLRQKLFFTASLPRMLIEVGLLGAVMLTVFPQAIEQPAADELTLQAFLLAACCGLWGAIRFGSYARPSIKYVAAAAVGGAVAIGMLVVIVLSGKWPLFAQDEFAPVRIILIFIITDFVYAIFRGAFLSWPRWNQMRKQRLLWSFTHIQIVIIVVMVAVGTVIFTVIAIIQMSRQGATTFNLFLFDVAAEVLPVIGTIILSTIFVVLILVLPLALLSYLLTRGTIGRLEDLAAGTAALRTGDLSTRVVVSGEDEVAQLQGDFNNMAIDLERAIADLEQERDRTAGLLRVQRELTAAVSHELRTPIATIQGYLQPMLSRTEEISNPDIHHDLAIISSETTRLQKLIDDLFALSRAEIAQLTLAIEPTDVALVAQRIVDVWQPLSWRQRRVEVIQQTAVNTHIALADTSRLEQILTNLIHNAVRHTPPGGIVAVAANSEGEWVVIDVQDTGDGIAPEALPLVWEPFFQGGENGRFHNEQTGLGLALVKTMTEAMGGSVAVTSAVGQGSRFEIRLPKA